LGTPVVANNNAAVTRTANSYAVPNTGTNISVTATTGTNAMVIVTGLVAPAEEGTGFMSFAVSGATTQGATDARAVIEGGEAVGNNELKGAWQASTTTVITNLTAGENTFTTQYKSSTGTTTFTNRTISVIPLG
jgi:hypothetical protein